MLSASIGAGATRRLPAAGASSRLWRDRGAALGADRRQPRRARRRALAAKAMSETSSKSSSSSPSSASMDKRHGLHCAARVAISRLLHRDCSQRARLRQRRRSTRLSCQRRRSKNRRARKRHRKPLKSTASSRCSASAAAAPRTRRGKPASPRSLRRTRARPSPLLPPPIPRAALLQVPTSDDAPAGPSASSSSASSRVLPQIQRLRAYQRIAEQQRVPFTPATRRRRG